jgi:hypothetical protein
MSARQDRKGNKKEMTTNTTGMLGIWMAAVLMTGCAVLSAEPAAGNAAGQPKSQPGLAAETPTPEAAPLPAEMASSKLSVQFDPQTQEPRTILNREAKDSLTLVPESAFRLELDKLEGTIVPAELAQQFEQDKKALGLAQEQFGEFRVHRTAARRALRTGCRKRVPGPDRIPRLARCAGRPPFACGDRTGPAGSVVVDPACYFPIRRIYCSSLNSRSTSVWMFLSSAIGSSAITAATFPASLPSLSRSCENSWIDVLHPAQCGLIRSSN